MPRVSEEYPSKYLKAAELQGRAVSVTIDDVQTESIGQGSQTDRRLVAYFKGKQKGLVLNKTNANTIASVYGDDTDDWKGQSIELFEMMVPFQGQSVPAIRVRVPRQPVRRPTPQPATAGAYDERNPPPAVDLDDEIPF